MRITQLAYLCAVVQEGSYTKAAKRLYVTPQAIAKSLESLQRNLKRPLFRKVGRSLEPTSFALDYAQECKALLDLYANLEQFATSYDDAETTPHLLTTVTVKAPYRGSVLEPHDFELFSAIFPQAPIDSRFALNENCASALKHRLVDAAIMLGPIDKPGIVCHRVGHLHLVVAMDAAHPLAQHDTLLISDFGHWDVALPFDTRFTFTTIFELYRKHHMEPRFCELAPTLQSHARFIKRGGLVIMFANNHAASALPQVTMRPLQSSSNLKVPLYLSYWERDERRLSRLYAYMVKLVREHPDRF